MANNNPDVTSQPAREAGPAGFLCRLPARCSKLAEVSAAETKKESKNKSYIIDTTVFTGKLLEDLPEKERRGSFELLLEPICF
jgi:hypothetical protein